MKTATIGKVYPKPTITTAQLRILFNNKLFVRIQKNGQFYLTWQS